MYRHDSTHPPSHQPGKIAPGAVILALVAVPPQTGSIISLAIVEARTHPADPGGPQGPKGRMADVPLWARKPSGRTPAPGA